VERLAGIVVGAKTEAGDPVAGRARGRQHEHHGPLVAFGDHLAQHVPVDARQVAIEDDHAIVAAIWAGAALLAGGIMLRLRDA
jgi:hypothetical protein